jgi:formate C-acetyltransferase
MLTGELMGVETDDPLSFTCYEQFEQAVYDQLSHLLKTAVETSSLADELRARYEPVPYMSAMIDGCMEKGLDLAEGGAVYNFITVEGVGFATAADSLAAVKKHVFDEGGITMAQLLEAVKANYEGYELIRQRLVHKSPKYGNDDLYADEIARDYSRYWSKEINRYVSPYTKRRYRAGYLSWNYFINMGPKTAATPDGRKRGEHLGNGVCPSQGADQNGPTAAFKSVANLGFDVVPNGASYTPSFSPGMFRDEEHRRKFGALLRSYEELGGTAMQINVIDRETLLDAQRNPEKYQNLLVRVTGYNAYFVSIGKALQNEIIARTVF